MDRRQIEAIAAGLVEPFADGLQFKDVITLTVNAMKAVEGLRGQAAAMKKHVVVEALKIVVDKTDTPWLPDTSTDPLIKAFLPSLVDTIAGAAKGLLGVNSVEATRQQAERAAVETEVGRRNQQLALDLQDQAKLLSEERERLAKLEEELVRREQAMKAEEGGGKDDQEPAAGE